MTFSRPLDYRFCYRVCILALLLFCIHHAARAQSVLYFSDGSLNSSGNITPQALSQLGITPTAVTTESEFVSQLSGNAWDLVIFMPQLDFAPDGETALVNWIGGGGKAIAASVSRNDTFATAFQATYTGQESILLESNGSPLWNGVSSSISLTNPGYDPEAGAGGYGSFSTDLSAADPGFSGGRFAETGDSSIVIGNNGFTILNGFLDDTYDATTQLDRRKLAENQIQSVLRAGTVNVPESGTSILLFPGLVCAITARVMFTRKRQMRRIGL